jgi:DNA-binding NarL/FixJ family response regulator
MNRPLRAPDIEPDDFDGLRATAANLKRLLGDDGARALADAFGGRRLYVPKEPGPHHPLTVVIGPESAAALASAFHGMTLDIPMLPATRAEILRLDALGWTRRAIARELKVTERWVYKTLSQAPTSPPRQGRLL